MNKMTSSSSPCAACKFLRRKCTQECVFASYFPPDQPQRFASVHKVFGASNVSKLLNELNAPQREDVVNSLVYEADSRLRDPVYGCVGVISVLQQKLKQVQSDLITAHKELAIYGVPSSAIMATGASTSAGGGFMGGFGMGMGPMMHAGAQLLMREQQNAQLLEAQQQLAAMAMKEEQAEIMMRNWEQQHQQQQKQFMSTYDASGDVVVAAGSGLALGADAFDQNTGGYDQVQPSQQQEDEPVGPLLLLQQPETAQQQQGQAEVAQAIPLHQLHEQQYMVASNAQHLILQHHQHQQEYEHDHHHVQQRSGSE